nr:GDP-L-fucose synthase [Caminibacter mediatlanticus]
MKYQKVVEFKMENNSKIFVAGSTGLVGSAIIKKLLEKGYQNIIANYHKRKPNIKSEKVRFIQLDLLDNNLVEEFFKNEKPEYVFLAAAKVGGIIANNTYRADFIYENLQIQNNVIYNAYKYGVKKLMFLGSTCIYPKNCPQPIKEEYLLTGELEYTNEPYAIAKIAGIKMCESFNLQYGTNFISVMPTNLYGENDNFDLEKSHVLPALIRKIHLGKALEENNWNEIRRDLDKNPIEGIDGRASKEEILTILKKYGILEGKIEIWGSGKPKREFLYSDDMADACVFLMENVDCKDLINIKDKENNSCDVISNSFKEIRNTHINIGTGKDISIKDLAYLIKDIIGYKGEFYFNTSKPDGTMRKVTDVSKLHSLGWRHKVELENGIKKIYEWYLR